jgi:hypothetical protein
MKRAMLSLMVLGCVAVGASPAAAQRARLSLGAGGMKPSGDYATADNTGWQLMGAIELGVPRSPLAIRIDGMYGQTTHPGGSLLSGGTKLSGGTADAVYRIGAPMVPVHLYVLAGLGYYKADLVSGGSETKPAFGGGAGLSLGVGPMKVFGEARYMTVRTNGSPLNFFPVSVGLTFGM